MSERPTWAAAPLRSSPAARAAGGRPPAALVAGVVGVLGLAAGEVAYVAGRDELRAALRAFLVAAVVAQVVLAAAALRRSPAAVMLLLLCVATTLVAALARGEVVPAVVAVVVLALLGRSLRWFPGYEL